MQLLQEALNKARKEMLAKNNGYIPPYPLARHAKPIGAAQDVCLPCGIAKDAAGRELGHPKLRCHAHACSVCPSTRNSLALK